jgi:hypothetical protein
MKPRSREKRRETDSMEAAMCSLFLLCAGN